MRAPRIILAGLVALGLSLASGSAAQALITYGPVGSFHTGAQPNNPVGVAVSQASGDVYVANLLGDGQPGALVHEYDRAGNLLTRFGPPGGQVTSGVAVDPLNGDVYVVDAQAATIETYGPSGGFISEFSIAGSQNFGFYTIVQIASDAAGNVYLPNAPNNEVQEFNPAGTVLATFTGSGGEALKEPTDVAVGAAGNVYVADNGNGRVEEFSPAGAFIMALGSGVNQTTGGSVCTAASGDTCGPGSDGSQAVAVDSSGEVLVGDNNGSGFHVVLYSPAGEKLSDFGMGTIGASEFGTIDTLAVGATGLVYVVDGSGIVWIYARQSSPLLVSESSSAVRQTAADLDVRIAPGYADTVYHIEYGASTAYGASIPVPEADIGSGGLEDKPVGVEQELTALQPGTVYHYRVVATNALGQTVGPDETFTTLPLQPPVLSTGQAQGVAQNTATLTGTVDTQGFQTEYEFDIGTDTGYGTRIFGNAGSEPGAHTFTVTLQGLAPGTTYHYRVAARNTFGTVYGVDVTFTTGTYPSATLAVPVSEPFVPALLLAPAPSSSSAAKTAGVGSAAHAARHGGAGKSSGGRPGGSRRGRRSRGIGRAHGASRGGGR